MSSTARLVFEIGTEELPPAAAWDGLRQLRDAASAAFAAARLRVEGVRAHATPRRLVLIADRVAPRQDDLVREVRGPAARVAFTPEGQPTPAAQGFARAQGVPVGALERRTTPQGEYVYAIRRERGGPAARVLAEILPALAGGLAFSKSMRWGTGAAGFARPIRWILALLGARIVLFDLGGVRAGRYTAGHRILHPRAIRVPSADTYEAHLRRGAVLLDPDGRRQRIVRDVTRAARGMGGRPILDPDLLEETVQLVEWPVALAGGVAEEFLALPREVLITVMQHHQKYFAVEDASGRLRPAFVAVRNGGTRGSRTVREGNEWVLRARLADARFFFEEDRKCPLVARVDGLGDLVFHEKLGTMAEKTRRLADLAGRLGGILGLDRETAAHLVRAAHLSKADLVTQMVRELPELQGVMGGIYARLDGEPHAVATAIEEQYLPRGSALPRSAVGAYLGLIDKMDTLVSALAEEIIPSGSEDPYGLRRAAQGIVAIILDRGLRVRIQSDLASAVLDAGGITDPRRRADASARAFDLIWQRLRGALIEEGISYDTADAALARGDDPADAAARARALWAFRRRSEFSRVYTAFDRAARILPRDFAGEVREDLITGPAERGLLDAVRRIQGMDIPNLRVIEGLERDGAPGRGARGHGAPGHGAPGEGAATPTADAARRYEEALRRLSTLADPVDRFFTDVLVMDPDEAIRANRLALLASVVTLIRPIADLSRVVVGEGKAAAAK